MFIEHSQPPETPELEPPTGEEAAQLSGLLSGTTKPLGCVKLLEPWERPEGWKADYDRNFSEALMMVQHGFHARRAFWDRKRFIKTGRSVGYRQCLIQCHNEDDLDVALYTPTPEDLFAKDWIVSR